MNEKRLKENSLDNNISMSILAGVCYSDEIAALVVEIVFPKHFGNEFMGHLYSLAQDHYLKYRSTIGHNLKYELGEKKLRDNDYKARKYNELLTELADFSEHLNTEYLKSKIGQYIEEQELKLAVVQAADYLDRSDVDRAKHILLQSVNRRFTEFDAGVFVHDSSSISELIERQQEGTELEFVTGVKSLDDLGVVPRRETLFVFMGPPHSGKTTFLQGVIKHNQPRGHRILEVGLEMSVQMMHLKLIQAMFNVPLKRSEQLLKEFVVDEKKGLFDVVESSETFPTLVESELKFIKYFKKYADRNQVILKNFPTGSLSFEGLVSYLDTLELSLNFIPDLLIIDYPKLMKFDKSDIRIALGTLYEKLRGLAQSRNLALVVVHQPAKKESYYRQWIRAEDSGEDTSIFHIADSFVTFSRTTEELNAGMGRLLIEKNRNGSVGQKIYVINNYANGIFSHDSVLIDSKLSESYWNYLNSG